MATKITVTKHKAVVRIPYWLAEDAGQLPRNPFRRLRWWARDTVGYRWFLIKRALRG